MLMGMNPVPLPEGFDPDALISRWTPEAEEGSAFAILQLVTVYSVKEDWAAAESWAQRALESDETFGTQAMAMMLRARGDEDGAREWDRRAQEAQRQTPAGRSMARVMAPMVERFGEEPDLEQVRAAAEAGDEMAMTTYGMLLSMEQAEEAVRWLTPRAEAGDTLAMFGLGAALSALGDEEGSGLWLERLAQTGELIMMELFSDFAERSGDEAKAEYWARRVRQAQEADADADDGRTASGFGSGSGSGSAPGAAESRNDAESPDVPGAGV